MRRGKVAELEERLNEIRNRRGLLESAFAEKQALLNQLDSARGDSMKRLVASIEEQNQKARERNYKFLEDILVASHQPSSSFSSFSTENNNSECKKRLLDAKKNFVRMMENALPSLHRSESIRLEEKMRSLQMEKMQSLQRREKLRHELANEEKVKMELEHQRRELVQSLALEQRDLMEAEASSAYLLAEGKLVDEHIKENVNTYGQQLEYILQDRLRNYSARDAVPRLASNPVPIPHSHVRPRVVDSHPAESLLATSQQVQFYSEEEEEEEEELLPESQPNQAPSKPESQFKTEVSSFHDDKSLPEAKSSSRQSTEFKLNTSVIQGKDQDTVQSFADSKDDFSEDSIHESKLTTTNNNDKEVPMGTNTSISIPLNRYDEVSEFDISLDHGATVQQPQNSIKVTNKEENATVATTSQKIESKTSATTGSTSSSATKLAPVEKSFVEPIDNNLPSLEELELGRCQSICNQIFSSILNKVTFDGQVKEIYQEQRSEADLRAVRYHIKSILDNDNRQVSPRNDKLQGDIVLAILSAKGDLLMPKEAFAGVVTMDKLRKEMKKSHIPGVLHFWDAIIKHLQSVVQVDEKSVEYLAKCFTTTLVEHVGSEDKDRLHRKLYTLLKVGIIPEEKDESFSESPYRRANTSSLPISNTMVEPFAPTVFENKGSRAASEVAKKIAEFDDDEFIAEDSVLEKPPQIKDLDEETSPNKKPTNTKPSSHADDVDEFDF